MPNSVSSRNATTNTRFYRQSVVHSRNSRISANPGYSGVSAAVLTIQPNTYATRVACSMNSMRKLLMSRIVAKRFSTRSAIRMIVLEYLHYDLHDARAQAESRWQEWLVEREVVALPRRAQVYAMGQRQRRRCSFSSVTGGIVARVAHGGFAGQYYRFADPGKICRNRTSRAGCQTSSRREAAATARTGRRADYSRGKNYPNQNSPKCRPLTSCPR